MPLAYLGKMSLETEKSIKEYEKEKIDDIIDRRNTRENEKDIRLKEREVNREMKRIEKEKSVKENEDNDKKRERSHDENEDTENAKKVITEVIDDEMDTSPPHLKIIGDNISNDDINSENI